MAYGTVRGVIQTVNRLEKSVETVVNSKLWFLLIKAQRFIMLWTSIIMLSILGIVVFARYGLNADVFGYDEIVLVDSFWMYFIGASYAMYEGSHVKADILARLFSIRVQFLMKVLAGVCQTIVNIVFNIFALSMILRSIETWPVTSSWGIPFLIPQMSILVGFTLMTFYLSVYTLRDLCSYMNVLKGNR